MVRQVNWTGDDAIPVQLEFTLELFDLTLGRRSPARTRSELMRRLVDSALLQALDQRPDLAESIARLIGPRHDAASTAALQAKLRSWGYPQVAQALDGCPGESTMPDKIVYRDPELPRLPRVS